MSNRGVRWAAALVIVGAALRLVLFVASPPSNANDDHMRPIAHYATHLSRPEPDACWQCYQPPLYYVVSAAILHAAYFTTADFVKSWRAVQLLNVLLSVAGLAIIWRILAFAGARDTVPRLCALGVVVCLPREIYSAVFLANDALLGFAVSLAVLLYLGAIENGALTMSGRRLAGLLAATAMAAWTKQHGLIVVLLPLALVVWERGECLSHRALAEWRGRRGVRLAVLAIGLLAIGSEELYKTAATGRLLMSNQDYFDFPKVQAPGSVEAISFSDFRPVALLREPTRSPATIDSFWTEIFAKLWFDYDPKFLTGTERSRRVAAVSYAAGLAVSSIWGLGLVLAVMRWRGSIDRMALLALQVAYLVVPLIQTLRFPYYSSMKAAFLLPALPISAILLSLGFEWLWERPRLRGVALGALALLLVAVLAQLLLIHQEIENALLASFRRNQLWRVPPGWGG